MDDEQRRIVPARIAWWRRLLRRWWDGPSGARCTCGAPATTIVAVYGLLCDEPGTIRNYTFCDPCTRFQIENSRGVELVGRINA